MRLSGAFDSALLRFVPDVALLLRNAEDNQPALDLAAARLSTCPKETPLIGIAFGGGNSRARLVALLSGKREFSTHRTTVCAPEEGDSDPGRNLLRHCRMWPGSNLRDFRELRKRRLRLPVRS